MSQQQALWKGKSGNVYPYFIHTLPYSCQPGVDGNYIFARLDIETKAWYAVYIGEGELNSRVNDKEHYKCATSKGATHVFVHTNLRQEDRKTEESDLLDGNPEAYTPTGCNQKAGG